MSQRSIRYLILAGCFALALIAKTAFGDCCPPQREDWRFRRSYFSHHVPDDLRDQYPVPRGRGAYRPAYYGFQPGFSVQGGFRVNRINIFSGTSNDTTVIYEGFFRGR